MNHISIKELLQWRQAQAEAEAPPAPRSGQLLSVKKKWWESSPEQFQKLATRLSNIQQVNVRSLAGPDKTAEVLPVPTLMVLGPEAVETAASMLLFQINDRRLQARCHLEGFSAASQKDWEVTFVDDQKAPQFATFVEFDNENNGDIGVELSEKLAKAWAPLKITDPMPFRLIIRGDE